VQILREIIFHFIQPPEACQEHSQQGETLQGNHLRFNLSSIW